MNVQKPIFSFVVIFLNLFISSLYAENKFDGEYKSEFLLPFNKIYAGDTKCPSNLPIKIRLIVKDNNITGNISNSSKCPNYQRAQIKGEIDNSGNIVKIKFNHFDKQWAPKDDAYKIEGNLNSELILKSKQKRMYKNQKFFFTYKNPSKRNDEYIDARETNISKNENEFFEESMKQQPIELNRNQLKEQKAKELEDLKEKKLKGQKAKELRELKIKKESNLIFD